MPAAGAAVTHRRAPERRGRGARARRPVPRAAVVAVALGLVAVLAAHLLHEHPHDLGREVVCAVCVAPLATGAPAPRLAPPALVPIGIVAFAPRPAPTPRAPLAFSPKQSPPA